ncbi:MAG TPA: copper resistance system multicopper oxidase [Gemmatimonadales bacterium]|nr:copper resistance system multicopper oxidase [Gemmatimonadales bacterium]
MTDLDSLFSRRSFLAAGSSALGMVAGLDRLLPGFARTPAGLVARPLRDQRGVFDLTIGEQALRIGGRKASTVAINGTVPGPLLRFREGETVTLNVHNALREDTSIHWHGIILPNEMDGVPGVTFEGIRAGESFTYQYDIRQNGTYWYHSHSGLQEQLGVYGPLIIDPAGADPISYDREHVVMLSDWTFDDPYDVMANLKKVGGYYNFQRRTIAGLLGKKRAGGLSAELEDRLRWGRMRMDATDIADVTGYAYSYLMNGQPAGSNWTGLFAPGERVRLRLINGSAATYFDFRIPGLPMTVVAVDGQHVEPVTTDELRIAIAETYDVIVEPTEAMAYTLFAETMDRSGFARGTLAPRVGMEAAIPARRNRPVRSMADMGMNMAGMAMGNMAMDMSADGDHAGHAMPESPVASEVHGPDHHGPGNSMVAEIATSRLDDPGVGLGEDGWRVLTYAQLRSLEPFHDTRNPEREIELHLTGNMERYMWSFDGLKFSQSPTPIPMWQGERVRIIFVNDTMMEHPIHLHGMFMELDTGAGAHNPLKHTVNVKPAERVSLLATPDVVGRWAMHCHILYHMEAGMFRVVEVLGTDTARAS